MKRLLSALILLLMSVAAASGKERIYLVTDRGTYLSGETVWCSLFCVDEKGRISNFSSVAYLELISGQGTAAEAKTGLFLGRGAGSFRLPENLPTGNYALTAYTLDGEPSPEGTRILSVFNPNSKARVEGGVRMDPDWKPAAAADIAHPLLQVTLPRHPAKGTEASLTLFCETDADLSVSVYHDDGLDAGDGRSLEAFLNGKAAPGGEPSEYEGEIIYATVEGLKNGAETVEGQVTAYLSSAGAPSQVYVGRNTADGQIQFFTSNIYGNRELVCEVVSLDKNQSGHINLKSPFRHPDPGEIPALSLSQAQRQALVARKAALREEAETPLDTLVRFLPKREDLLLDDIRSLRYHLDDYTRFSTIREICVEIIPQLQFTRRDGLSRIRMILPDPTESRRYMQDNILVMMDGVVITDHGMLEDFDAMLIDDVDLYMQPILLGGLPFNGAVNFITRNNYVTALHFPDNVRVIDYQGLSYPVAYPGGAPSAGQDLRQLLYFHPGVQVKGRSAERLTLHLPAYGGRFRVVAEGWTPEGTPIRAAYSFTVQ